MKSPEPSRDVFVVAIDGKQILNEIVCTQTEEIGFLDDLIDQEYRRRDLDHRADPRIPKRDVLPCRVVLLTFNQRADFGYFRGSANHRQDEVDRSIQRRTENSAKLRPKMIPASQSEPDRTQPKCWILFAAMALSVHLLGTEIEGADLHTVIACIVGDLAIRLVLLVLGRESLEPVEQELGPVETYASSADPLGSFIDVGKVDVDPNGD